MAEHIHLVGGYMKTMQRVVVGATVCMLVLAGQSGCQSKPHGPGMPMISSGHGQSPVMPNVRMTSSDGSYDYLVTARREVDGSQAYPFGKQILDLGHGQAGGSSARLQLEKGFAVFGGCFPVAPAFKPDRDAGMLPRPWPVVAVVNAAIGAEGTKFSVYMETNANGTDKCQYVFKHSGGPVHAWTYAPGTDPMQATSQIVSIPRNETSPTYL